MRVTTAAELRDAVLAAAADADVVVMAAAVADFRPAATAGHEDQEGRRGRRPRPDRARAQRRRPRRARGPSARPGQVVVGFAAETGDADGDVLAHGRAKLARKGCDLLVVNEVGEGRGFEVADNAAVVLGADGSATEVPPDPRRRSPTWSGTCVAARLPER